jgi:cytochrome c peroxidase
LCYLYNVKASLRSLPLVILLTVTSSIFAAPKPEVIRKMWSSYFTPVEKPVVQAKTESKIVTLGRELFYEKGLSVSGDRSCNDCHDLQKYGTNGSAALEARKEGKLRRDVPSLYNLEGMILMGWDGATKDLRTKTAHTLTNPEECGFEKDEDVVKTLQSLPGYEDKFRKAFSDANTITFDYTVEALVKFQEGLVTSSPFDAFLLGNNEALSEKQLEGALLFEQKNCSACHTGSAIGGQMIQIAGIIQPWPNQNDLGHFEVSGNSAHKMGFRVPPLRNVTETAPYFHDHSARSLLRAIRDISLREQGLYLTFDEILSLEAFLKSFTGEIPTEYIQPREGVAKVELNDSE